MSDENNVIAAGGKPFRNWPALQLDNHERADHSSGKPEPTNYSDPEWWRGWTAGRLGLPTATAKKMFEQDAERRRLEYVLAVETECEKANAEAAVLADRRTRQEKLAENVENAYEKLEADRVKNPTGYSWPLGVFYCVVAVVLWIADLPLSLLAADGLGIRTNYRALEDLTVIRSQWQTMWEPLAFAIGIAALALFFKFVADFFFKPHYLERWWIRGIAAFLLLAVLALVGGNLFLLARLRTGVRSLQELQRQSASGVIPPGLDVKRREMEEQANLSFILLTLTLPLIGGICASAGWSRLQNSRRLSVLTSSRLRFRGEADKAVEASCLADAKLKGLQLARAGADKSSLKAAEAAFALYLDGYHEGYVVPETIHSGRRLHDRVQFVLKQWIGIAQQRHSQVRASRIDADEDRA